MGEVWRESKATLRISATGPPSGHRRASAEPVESTFDKTLLPHSTAAARKHLPQRRKRLLVACQQPGSQVRRRHERVPGESLLGGLAVAAGRGQDREPFHVLDLPEQFELRVARLLLGQRGGAGGC